jgi:SH3-like domain-containing protein
VYRPLRHVVGVLTLAAIALFGAPAASADPVGPVSGLPMPRFVSLKADKVAIRRGPSKNHEIRWVYQRSGLPVEVIAEFENWRRIRDSDGADGWVYHSLLSGRRTGLVMARGTDDLIPLHTDRDAKSSVLAKLEPGVLGSVRRCDKRWCRISIRGTDGWVEQVRLWGVYPDEAMN